MQKPRRPVPSPSLPEAQSNAAASGPERVVPIVGIGASAGGLEALDQFLRHVPRQSGLAFVVVQHLDPTQKGMLPELLQRATAMPVAQIEDGMTVVPDHVYVIPPNRDLSILHGVLQLHEPIQPRGLRLPIDFFFRSLADDQEGHSVGVVLSGMGSDGTLGLRAIKGQAGGAFAQAPASAKFDGMPTSAIEAGLVDVVAPAEELPSKIIAYLQSLPHGMAPRAPTPPEKEQSDLQKIILLLRTHTGHDFSGYKRSTLSRRIERRMGLHQLNTLAHYARYLRENPQEAQLLFKELLIGVTCFFRDPPVWEQLKENTIPALLAAHSCGGGLRAWVPACSTGEEAYSLAIVFREALERVKPGVRHSLQIFATDLDQDAIDKARSGVYPVNIAADVSEERLHRFFVQEEFGYRVNKEIRETVIFATQNVLKDPPFTKLDLLSCRNLFIYLEPALQKRTLRLFHYSLNPEGVLVLGTSESVGLEIDSFTPLPESKQIYRRRSTAQQAASLEFPTGGGHRVALSEPDSFAVPRTSPSATNVQSLTDSLLLRQHAPAAVLTTDQGDIVYVNGKTGRFLEPPMGKANWNIFAMARESLRGALYTAFSIAVRERATSTIKALPVGNDDVTHLVDVTVQYLTEPKGLHGMVLIVFANVAKPAAKKKRKMDGNAQHQSEQLEAMTAEFQRTQDDLRATREEMQASHEELKSANEELQSTNEELQSANEELTSTKEEMESMNEELQTVNQELLSKVDKVSRASDDMKNLLEGTAIATLFLDRDLRVRLFTMPTTRIIKLIPRDVGRQVTDLSLELDYPDFVPDARNVLLSVTACERQVLGRDGRSFAVRIVPYRTEDNQVDGLVITFVDVSAAIALSAAQSLEIALREALTALQSRVSDQTAALEAAGALEDALRKAKTGLEARVKEQSMELQQALDALQSEKARNSP